MNAHVPVIVATGGPCGGKTNLLARIAAWCSEHGYFPLILPEVATMLIGSNFSPADPLFQVSVLRVQKALLEEAHSRAEASAAEVGLKPVIICDRGLMDGLAYCSSRAEFEDYLQSAGLTYVEALTHPTGVIHLQSAAIGAAKYYTLENNSARRETAQEAKALDRRTLDAWNGTGHLSYIRNRRGGTFEDKMQECLRALARTLGVPEPLECERKFKVEGLSLKQLPKNAVGIEIVQTYLQNTQPGVIDRVRARGIGGHWLYFYTSKAPISAGVVIENERRIDAEEYKNLLRRADTMRLPITKTRYCYPWKEHYLEIDVFKGRHTGIVIAEIEVSRTDLTTPLTLPTFLGNRVEEVTGNIMFSNAEMARP